MSALHIPLFAPVIAMTLPSSCTVLTGAVSELDDAIFSNINIVIYSIPSQKLASLVLRVSLLNRQFSQPSFHTTNNGFLIPPLLTSYSANFLHTLLAS
jgi:hypothetical protein